MATIKYERFEEWLEKLKTSPKETVIYIDVMRMKKSETLVSSSIIFQVLMNNDLNYCVLEEDMPSLNVIPEWVFNVLSTEELRKQAFDDYGKTVKMFDESVEKEYADAVELVKSLGYKNVVMGVVQ